MFLKKLSVTVMLSLAVWISAICFFALFGRVVLLEPQSQGFFSRFLLLEAGTAGLLWRVTVLYRRLDKSAYSGIKFGVWGSAIGLGLDTFALWKRDIFFSALSSGQVIAFTIWMSFAYALYLLIPLMMEYRRTRFTN